MLLLLCQNKYLKLKSRLKHNQGGRVQGVMSWKICNTNENKLEHFIWLFWLSSYKLSRDKHFKYKKTCVTDCPKNLEGQVVKNRLNVESFYFWFLHCNLTVHWLKMRVNYLDSYIIKCKVTWNPNMFLGWMHLFPLL